MIYETLSVQKTGMITLPKKWLKLHPCRYIIAEEVKEGLLLRPLDEILDRVLRKKTKSHLNQ